MAETDGLTIEYRPIDRPKPNARNARTHSPEQVAQIAASTCEFGVTNPLRVEVTIAHTLCSPSQSTEVSG
jgi:hypothetical protein